MINMSGSCELHEIGNSVREQIFSSPSLFLPVVSNVWCFSSLLSFCIVSDRFHVIQASLRESSLCCFVYSLHSWAASTCPPCLMCLIASSLVLPGLSVHVLSAINELRFFSINNGKNWLTGWLARGCARIQTLFICWWHQSTLNCHILLRHSHS